MVPCFAKGSCSSGYSSGRLDSRAAFADSGVAILEPERTEAFVGHLPYGGDYILKALAKLDSMPSSWS
jgi:hypothetical protein